jgi:hypothetical protein
MARHPHEPAALRLVVRRAPCTCRGSCSASHLVITTPITPGWAMPVTTPAELALAVERAWTEATIAAYARLRGVLYDLAETEERIPEEAYAQGRRHPAEAEPDRVERRRRTKHPGTHPPEQWVELSDGALLSPRGRRYGPETRVASAVRARLDCQGQR